MAFDQQGRQGDQTVSQGRTSVYGTRQTGQSQGASQYTRQYQTHQPYGRVQAQSGQASQDADEPQKRGVLSEFSGSAVIASALAAVTSFALQSKIGLAGSIIGVGVAAAATTIASQVYKGMLSASAQKLKDLSDQAPTTNGAYGATRDLRASSGTTQAWAKPVSLDDAASEAGVADSGTPIAPQSVRDAAQSRKGALVRKRMAIVMAVAAVAAVLVYALIVNLATSGQGIGSTEPIVATSSQSQDDQQSQDDGAAKGKGTKSQQTKGNRGRLEAGRQVLGYAVRHHGRREGLLRHHDGRHLRQRLLRHERHRFRRQRERHLQFRHRRLRHRHERHYLGQYRYERQLRSHGRLRRRDDGLQGHFRHHHVWHLRRDRGHHDDHGRKLAAQSETDRTFDIVALVT